MSKRLHTLSNKPDAVNPAMALWLTIEAQWRRVTDLERWAEAMFASHDEPR
jgi:hypothetical protein